MTLLELAQDLLRLCAFFGMIHSYRKEEIPFQADILMTAVMNTIKFISLRMNLKRNSELILRKMNMDILTIIPKKSVNILGLK